MSKATLAKLAALTLALLLHLLLPVANQWQGPLRAEPVVIEAVLLVPPAPPVTVAPPSQPPPPPQRPRPRPPAPQPAPEGPRFVASTPGEPVDEAQLLAAAAEAAPAPPAPPVGPILPVSVDTAAAQAWPRKGLVNYQVRYGESTHIARMRLNWSHDGERYRIEAEAATIGLTRLLKRFDGVQRSEGWVGAEGLAPERFWEDLNGKKAEAVFDWDAHTVTLSRPGRASRTEPIEGLAQDVLSLAHHLAFQPDSQERLKLHVVGGRWSEAAELSQVANEILRLPRGRLLTRHFHCETDNGRYIIDIWLARDHRNAPVRIRVEDREEDVVLDQVAETLELDGVKVDFEWSGPSNEQLQQLLPGMVP